jgi:transcriptional regulator with XRE-family HTH domain
MTENNYSVIDYKSVGGRLAELRGTLSQTEFADKFQITQANLSKYETGSVKAPLDLLFKISMEYKRSRTPL